MQRRVERITKYVARVSYVACFVLMVMICIDVITRFAGSPMKGGYEIAESLMIVVVFLSLGQTHVEGGHVSVKLLVDRFSPRKQAIVDTIVFSLAFVYAGLMTWQTGLQVGVSIRTGEVFSVLEYPVAPIRAVIPVGCFILALNFICTSYHSAVKVVRG